MPLIYYDTVYSTQRMYHFSILCFYPMLHVYRQVLMGSFIIAYISIYKICIMTFLKFNCFQNSFFCIVFACGSIGLFFFTKYRNRQYPNDTAWSMLEQNFLRFYCSPDNNLCLCQNKYGVNN